MVSPRISHPILSRLAHVQKNDDLRTSSWSFCSFILALFNFSLETSAVVGPEFTGNPCGEKKPWATNPQKIKDSVWKLSQEHVVLTWCINGFIYGMRRASEETVVFSIQHKVDHAKTSIFRPYEIVKIGMNRGAAQKWERHGKAGFTIYSCYWMKLQGNGFRWFQPKPFWACMCFFGGETLLTEQLPNEGGAYGPTNTSRWDKRGRALHRWPAGLRLYVGHGDETLGIFMDLGVFFPWKWVITRFTLYLCHRVGTIYNLVVDIYKNGGGYM